MHASEPSSHTHRAAPPAAVGLSRRDFDRLARFIHDTTGILMPPGKHTLMEGRLRRRIAVTGCRDFESYCDFLFSAEGQSVEAIHLIDAITTNKTDFFREPEHFRALQESILPAVLAADPAPGTVKIWSSAASTGAEAYTIAMVAAQALRSHPQWRVDVLGTDISTAVLRTAAAAIYPAAMIQPVPADLRAAYILRDRDRGRGLVRMAPALRAMTRFARLNLVSEHYAVDRDFDVVFCRNVLIYFDRPTQEKVVRRLCTHLKPGGTLILGHSEALAGAGLPLRPIGSTMFRKG